MPRPVPSSCVILSLIACSSDLCDSNAHVPLSLSRSLSFVSSTPCLCTLVPVPLQGIHNMFIVIPQFFVTGLSSIIFAIVDPDKSVLHGHHPGNGTITAASQDAARQLFAIRSDDSSRTKPDSIAIIFRCVLFIFVPPPSPCLLCPAVTAVLTIHVVSSPPPPVCAQTGRHCGHDSVRSLLSPRQGTQTSFVTMDDGLLHSIHLLWTFPT